MVEKAIDTLSFLFSLGSFLIHFKWLSWPTINIVYKLWKLHSPRSEESNLTNIEITIYLVWIWTSFPPPRGTLAFPTDKSTVVSQRKVTRVLQKSVPPGLWKYLQKRNHIRRAECAVITDLVNPVNLDLPDEAQQNTINQSILNLDKSGTVIGWPHLSATLCCHANAKCSLPLLTYFS